MLLAYRLEGNIVRIEQHPDRAAYLATINNSKYLPITLSLSDVADPSVASAKIVGEKFLMDTWQGSTGVLWS